MRWLPGGDPLVRSWLLSIAGLIGFLVGAYVLLTWGLPLLLPFVLAAILAELIDPAVELFTFKNKIPRGIAVTVILSIVVGILTLAITAAIGRLIQEIEAIIVQLPYLYAMAMKLGARFAEQFGAFHDTLPASIQSLLRDNLGLLQGRLEQYLPRVVGKLGKISSIPALMANLLVMIIATFFISRDKRIISDFVLSLFPKTWRPKLQTVKGDVWSSTIGWAKAEAFLVVLTTLMTIVGLTILGSNYSVLIGLIVGVADLLPVVGPATIVIPWAIFSFVAGNKWFAFGLIALYAFNSGVRQVLQAKLVGDQAGLHPLAILVSIYLGFQFFGALGFLAGPLLAILLKAMIKSGLLPIFQEQRPTS